MKKGNAAQGWDRWRRKRYHRLTAQGLHVKLAWKIANEETTARSRIARVIGSAAARDAALACASINGDLRFYLAGKLDGLTDAQIERLKKFVSDTAA